jgi:predicted dehydrogenase
MIESDGRQWLSYVMDDAPATGGQDDEIAMDKTVRVGLVGLGGMGRCHAANLADRIPGARLVRTVDAAEDVAREKAARLRGVEWSTRYEDLLEDPEVEAVVVASPTPLHAEMAAATAAAGKHVFCEKPISLELEHTRQVIETARAAGVELQMGFHRRFDPDYRAKNRAIGTFEVSPLAPGRKAKESFEVNGSKGSLVFELERMNELPVYFEDDEPETSGFRTLLVTEPRHPYMAGWWPPGHIIGYEHTIVQTVKDLLDGIKTGNSSGPTFEDGYRCQAVLDAVERSLESRGWAKPETYGATGGASGEA